jgi:hypothetical protein
MLLNNVSMLLCMVVGSFLSLTIFKRIVRIGLVLNWPTQKSCRPFCNVKSLGYIDKPGLNLPGIVTLSSSTEATGYAQ